ncbi:hypothetical protein [Dermatobacter hominis]|uniref:hypothetical protein n=1 Tax=Dermatobacter hominis TaxID=2884263 RepID=UPI001D0FFD80|nr:hypothetical protein [Dermatobacter hominis]UDY37725.1 hypothetical protein LH044_09330 [Dermatobacter hominis]
MEPEQTPQDVPSAGDGHWSEGASDLGILLAGLTGGAGLIHLVMVPEHAGGGSWIDPVGFAVVGWLQIALAVVFLLRRGGRALAVTAAVLNAAALGVWIWARTVGLPFGSHAGIVEEVGLVDGVCAGLEATAVVVAVVMAVAPRRLRIGLLVPSIAAVAVLGLATVGITSPGTAEHAAGGHSHGDEAAAAGHSHGTTAVDAATHDDQMSTIDAARCDLGFNPKSYWTEAAALGVDTYGGGSMDMSVTTAGDITDVVGADEGRGSAGLDKLVAATSKADSGAEADAAGLVVALAQAEDDDYKAWRGWMAQRTAAAGGGHAHGSSGAAAAPDDNGGHGGHAGPTPWKAIVDQDQCVALAQELDVARKTALALPTAADAMAAGYVRVTGYVPGIAAHYMKFPYVDGEFHVDQPEMVLYDGGGPEARVVGLSYYLIQPGEAEPTQGFTGDNDHYHRHVGLCTSRAGVVGDSSTTEEECAELGGVKANGSAGWMSHAWVVPGCESPWGVFSGASPILDRALSDASGQNDGACSASSGRDRYDLSPGGKATGDSGERAEGDGG